jgi:hypothetical protein
MNYSNYSTTSTEELIQRFIENARLVGGGHDTYGKPYPKSPEAQAIKGELRAVATELRARKPLVALRRLYDHESPDVRSWASGQFVSIDPEWSSAGTAGIIENLSATEVMELRKRALIRPPLRPTLRQMSVEQLKARFEDAAIRQYASQFLSDEKGGRDVATWNRIAGETYRIAEELKGRGSLVVLLPLLGHPNVVVRWATATRCLPIAPERAIPILEDVAAQTYRAESMHASDTLDQWRQATAVAITPVSR